MPPRLTAAEIEKRRALYEDSALAVAEAASRAGCGVSTIYSYALRCGWAKRAERRKPRLSREEIRALYEEGLVPVGEIARIARLAEHTIYVYAARGGWKPRASRLRLRSAGSDDIADVAAEVADARRRATAARLARAEKSEIEALLQLARAAPARPKRRVWLSPEEQAAIGLDPRGKKAS